MNKDKCYLTTCELQVMKIIWEGGQEMNLPKISEAVNVKFHRDWSPQMVSTFLSRLAGKKFLTFKRVGRTCEYPTLVTRADYLALTARQFCEFWFDGDAEAASEYFKNL